MNPDQRPRDEHGSPGPHAVDPCAQDPRTQNSAFEGADGPRTEGADHRAPRGDDRGRGPDHAPSGASTPQDSPPRPGAADRPQYGIRVDPAPTPRQDQRGTHAHGRGTARGSAPGSAPAHGERAASPTGTAHDAAPAGSEARTTSTRAARRMGRGLSFTVIMLGLLAGLALVAMDLWFGWVVGAILVVLGVLGYALVQTRALPVFQDPGEPERRSWSKLWLIPAVLLVPGFACLGMAFVVPSWLGPSVPADLLDDYVLAFIVGGMTMVVGAGLGFGLVATARFTRPDDDDSPLRPTDYADRLRERERGTGDTHYDSDWIKRDPRA